MFETFSGPSFETVLIVLRGVMLIGAFWVFALAFTRWRRANERDAQQLSMQLERAFAEMRSLHETVSVMSARIEALAERVESESHLAPVGVTSASRGYDLAMRLAKNGAPIDDLVSNCGLTRHEAELLTRVHSAKRESAPPRQSSTRVDRESAPRPSPPPAAQSPTPPRAAGGRKRGSLLSVVG